MSLRRSLAALALLATAPVAAQFQMSESYKFLQAVKDGKDAEVTAALNKPGSQIVNTRSADNGDAALHIVARRGDLRYLNFLLARGADVNIRDGRNNTAMLVAIDAGHGTDVVPVLIARKANPNLANASGETPLIRAVQRRDVALVRTLLAAKADPDQRDVIAGLSARDYANRDARAAAIAKVLAETPRVTKAAVAGPKL